jgi:hypothetical protein
VGYADSKRLGELHKAYCNPKREENVRCTICGCLCSSRLKCHIDHFFVVRFGGEVVYYWRRRRICAICNRDFLEEIRRHGHAVVATSHDLVHHPFRVENFYGEGCMPDDVPASKVNAVREAADLYRDATHVLSNVGREAFAERATKQWAERFAEFCEGRAAPSGGVVPAISREAVSLWRAFCRPPKTGGAPWALPSGADEDHGFVQCDLCKRWRLLPAGLDRAQLGTSVG